MNLFPEPELAPKPGPDFVPPLGKTVQKLAAYGYDEKIVWTWPRAKAEFVLDARRREEEIATRRANATAQYEGLKTGDSIRGQPTDIHRQTAALEIREALAAGDPDELALTLGYTMHALSDVELREWAETVASVLANRDAYRIHLQRIKNPEREIPE